MAKFTNTTDGAKGINVKATKDAEGHASTTWIEPGATVEIDDALVHDKVLPDGIEKGEAAAKKAASEQPDAA